MRKLIPLLIFTFLLSSCGPVLTPVATPSPAEASTSTSAPSPTASEIPATQTVVWIASVTPTPKLPSQKMSPHVLFGPELEDFPEDVDPLTGLRVSHPDDLRSSAVLVSISNSPVSAKPQAGLSFASMVNEFFLGYGTTRFLSVFYGERARRVSFHGGDCLTQPEMELPENWIGGRAWFDENENGILEDWELGVPGVCLTLTNTATGEVVAETGTTDNGYYFFDTVDISSEIDMRITAVLPKKFAPTLANIGFEDKDSDLDPETRTIPVPAKGKSAQNLGLGFAAIEELRFTYTANEDAPDRTYVGPIRSGRLSYNDFGTLFPTGCLVFASAGADILPQLDPCELIFGEEDADNPNTSLLDIDHLRELSEKSNNPIIPINYSGNLFDQTAPEGGAPAITVNQFFHQFSQAKWVFDPQSESYLRYTDDLDGSGILHADIDRLTNRQLMFENVIYLFADYEIYRHNQYDISLCCGLEGWATLFRDGQMYRIRWSTNNRDWEKRTGIVRPIKFIGADKLPFPLKPGNTWISLYTTNSAITQTQPGTWQALFAMPNDLAPE